MCRLYVIPRKSISSTGMPVRSLSKGLDFARGARYAAGMTRKIAISLPDSAMDRVRAAIRTGRAQNVSNYIARLIEDATATETFEEMIDSWVREGGASPREIEAALEESRRAFERVGLTGKGNRREKSARKAG